jgi:hypothetical protein
MVVKISENLEMKSLLPAPPDLHSDRSWTACRTGLGHGLSTWNDESPPPAKHGHISSMAKDTEGDGEDGSADSECTLSNPSRWQLVCSLLCDSVNCDGGEHSSKSTVDEADYQRRRKRLQWEGGQMQTTRRAVHLAQSARSAQPYAGRYSVPDGHTWESEATTGEGTCCAMPGPSAFHPGRGGHGLLPS